MLNENGNLVFTDVLTNLCLCKIIKSSFLRKIFIDFDRNLKITEGDENFDAEPQKCVHTLGLCTSSLAINDTLPFFSNVFPHKRTLKLGQILIGKKVGKIQVVFLVVTNGEAVSAWEGDWR